MAEFDPKKMAVKILEAFTINFSDGQTMNLFEFFEKIGKEGYQLVKPGDMVDRESFLRKCGGGCRDRLGRNNRSGRGRKERNNRSGRGRKERNMSDLIDREAVREFIKSYRHSTDVAFDMEDHLDEIPAASPWHRVEERLPDDSRDVIIFTASRIIGVGSFIRPNWYQWYSGGGLPVDVTHWMPLPEPPKEGMHENRDHP